MDLFAFFVSCRDDDNSLVFIIRVAATALIFHRIIQTRVCNFGQTEPHFHRYYFAYNSLFIYLFHLCSIGKIVNKQRIVCDRIPGSRYSKTGNRNNFGSDCFSSWSLHTFYSYVAYPLIILLAKIYDIWQTCAWMI